MTSNLKFAWDMDTLKWDTNHLKDTPYEEPVDCSYITDMKFAWDTTQMRDFSQNNEIAHRRREPAKRTRHSNYAPSTQQNVEPLIIQPQSAPQVQYIPQPIPVPQYIPQPQQAPQYIPMPAQQPVIVNSGVNKKSGFSKFIEFLLFAILAVVVVYFLLQSPDTVDGISTMINNGISKITNFIGSVSP